MDMTKNMKVIVGLFSVVLLFTYGCEGKFEKIDPEITWENPADIGVGVLLSETQLNATADAAGTFTYTPGIGVALDEGENQELKVEFAPKHLTAFNTASHSVFINVINKGTSNAVFNETLTYGSVADIDGNAYKTITIGEQTWMAQNLRTTKYRNGEDITNVASNSTWVALQTEAYSGYNNTTDLDELATHGLLYNWHAVSDSRNIAPEGWHVATQSDWDKLVTTVGGVAIAGAKLKEAGTLHWNSGSGVSNSSGFTALPSGRRQYTDGTFINSGFNGFWWSSTANGPDFAFYYQLNYDSNPIVAANFLKSAGYAVRCVKD